MEPAAIRLTDVRAGYGSTVVLDGASCEFSPRRTTAIIGPGGSGKSTLLKLLNSPSRGLPPGLWCSGHIAGGERSVFVGQRPSSRERDPRSVLGVSCVDAALHQINAVWRGVSETLRRRMCQELHTPRVVATIEQRRLLEITIAVAGGGAPLLLDEPLYGLGPRAGAAVRQLLQRLRGSRTIIVVSHNLLFTRAISDEVLFLLDGEIVESGATREVFENPRRERTRMMITWGA